MQGKFAVRMALYLNKKEANRPSGVRLIGAPPQVMDKRGAKKYALLYHRALPVKFKVSTLMVYHFKDARKNARPEVYAFSVRDASRDAS